MSFFIMSGAVFFHTFTPLGWRVTWQVTNLKQCQGIFELPNYCIDANLANMALSIVILSIVMIIINRK